MSVVIYTTRWCPYCIRAKRLLDQKSVDYSEIAVDNDAARRREMVEKSGRSSVPQIWIRGEHIGGCDELYQLEHSDQLDAKLLGQ